MIAKRLTQTLFLLATMALLAPPAGALDVAAEAEAKPKTSASDNGAKKAEAKPAAKTAANKATDAKAEEKSKKAKAPTKARYAYMVLKGSLPESPGEMGPFGETGTDLGKTIERLDRAAGDDKIQGVVLELRSPSVGRGTIDELRAAIKRFRKSGKKVHAQLEIATTSDYLIASACDEIAMPESGFVLLPGVRLEPIFYKGLMNLAGVKADFLHMGEAKGAGETYTRRKWSEPVKQNLDSMAGDLYEQMVETITRDRPITEDKARECIDLALLTATQAKEAGLIDRVAYADEVRSSIAAASEADKLVYVKGYGRKDVDTDFSGPTGFFKLMQMITGGNAKEGRRAGKQIAVVYAVGAIMTGESSSSPFGGGATMGSTTIIQALDEADKDDSVAAIVLRVNSPGGSAVASDLMWRKIQTIKKPVIASMGDVAASGGYYISMGTDKIYAEPGTITGSIGVVSGKFAVKGMFNRLGLSTDVVSRGKNSAIFSAMRKWNASERAAMMRMMEDTYAQFTGKAAEGRKMPLERLKSLAGGKVYTGRQAKANGLVDETGTLDDAIAEAKRLAAIGPDEKVRIKTLPEPKDFFETLLGGVAKEQEVRLSLDGTGLPDEITRAAHQWRLWSQLLEREPVGLMMPYDLVVE